MELWEMRGAGFNFPVFYDPRPHCCPPDDPSEVAQFWSFIQTGFGDTICVDADQRQSFEEDTEREVIEIEDRIDG